MARTSTLEAPLRERLLQARGAERWELLEAAATAALQSGDDALAEECIEALDRASPNSRRVACLRAAKLEAQGQCKGALDAYNHILEAGESLLARRRRLRCLQVLGPAGYKAGLQEHLRLFPSDEAVWHMLVQEALRTQDYACAGFGLEELLLLCPSDYRIHVRYGELLCTWNPKDPNDAIRCFQAALELCPGNLRALYALRRLSPPDSDLHRWSHSQITMALANVGAQ